MSLLCNEYEGEEIRVLLHRPVYYDIRLKYLCVQDNVFYNYASFKEIMERNGPLTIQKLSLYIN